MRPFLLILLCSFPLLVSAQIAVTVDLSKESHTISPYLYGRNNSLSGNPGSGFTPEWTRLKDARVRFFREGGGNNSTKYNWRRKMSSHPDWYNNVYDNDWGYAAQSLQQNIPTAQGMWSFQLIGKAAMTNSANFNDWGYNNSQWWEGVNQNLAGGGAPNTAGGTKALTEGDPDLYLEDWTADSTTLILNHWFDDLALDKTKLQYWNMDNEPEIWEGTHDDVMPVQISAEQFMQRYFEVAKKARERYPEIKLVGPVPANEWQWYNWPNGINSGGKNYPWLEYFIKRLAEEQAASGVRLLDVLDIHFYPSTTDASKVVQYHRVFFDKNYVFPEANGVKNVNGSWDNNQTKEYIFERCKAWLEQYIGADHGVTFGLTETGISNISASTTAVWYASTLGEFMKHPEMEIFTPWSWQTGMWEVLHLYSRYNKEMFVPATSSEEEFVSAYPTITAAGDSITLVLVNRSVNTTKSVNVNFKGYDLANESFQTLKLSNLPSTETFTSHTVNALQKGTVTQGSNSISLSLSPLSITTVLLKGQKGEVITGVESEAVKENTFKVYPNPIKTSNEVTIEINKPGNATLELIDLSGRVLRTIYQGEISSPDFEKIEDMSGLSKGMYFFRLNLGGEILHRKVFTF
ncbi:MAG TPA: glycoside hydrolase family 44 protein [Cyclobacteriaceae bacterium]|nr:glycoside hydrolase family 44 protein [Cyclobacteriaceae bacterium]